MWRSPLPKGILGDPHLAHMIASSVPSSRNLRMPESVRPAKLNTRSAVALAAGIDRNWRAMTAMRGKRACPTSLHQTRTSTSCVCLIHPRSCQWQRCCGSQASAASPAFPSLCSQLPMSVVICHLKLTAQSAQEIRSCTTNDNNQTSYKVYLWPQHDEGERSLLVACEKAGHGHASRYSCSLRSQIVLILLHVSLVWRDCLRTLQQWATYY